MKLTNNFSKKEFDSKDGAEMPNDVLMNVQKLASQLQILRNNINKPITINSGYRSPEHNDSIKNSSSNSQHILGKAADIKVKGISTRILAALIEDLINDGDMLQGGLGIYDTFVHYDVAKGKKRRWDYR